MSTIHHRYLSIGCRTDCAAGSDFENFFLSTVKGTQEVIGEQIQRGFSRRSEKEIKRVFDKYADGDPQEPESLHVPKNKMMTALQEFDISYQDKSEQDVAQISELFDQLDLDRNGKLDYSEFRSAVQSNKTVLEDWAKSLPLDQLLADSIPRSVGHDPLEIVRRLTDHDIELVAEGFAGGLKQMLREFMVHLNEALDKVSERNACSFEQKFVADVPRMLCGNIDDFHKGLVARIGNSL